MNKYDRRENVEPRRKIGEQSTEKNSNIAEKKLKLEKKGMEGRKEAGWTQRERKNVEGTKEK